MKIRYGFIFYICFSVPNYIVHAENTDALIKRFNKKHKENLYIYNLLQTEQGRKAYFTGMYHAKKNMIHYIRSEKDLKLNLSMYSSKSLCKSLPSKLQKSTCPIIKASTYKAYTTHLKAMKSIVEEYTKEKNLTTKTLLKDPFYGELIMRSIFIERILKEQEKTDPDYDSLPRW